MSESVIQDNGGWAMPSAGAGPSPASLPFTGQMDGLRGSMSPTQPPTAAHTSRLRVGERVRVDTEDGRLPGVIKHVLDASHYRSSVLKASLPAADLLLTAHLLWQGPLQRRRFDRWRGME